MASNVQRGGLGFEKFFKRKRSSVEHTKDSEKIVNNGKDDTSNLQKEPLEIGKSGKQSGDKNNSDDSKNAASDADEISEKVESRKSSNEKKQSDDLASRVDDKKEACMEYVIKDDIGQVKLTEIINNSIKEAVLNIVKESICPLRGSPDVRRKDTDQRFRPSMGEETQDKEDESGNFPSLLPSGNESFDSHLSRNQCPRSFQSPYKSNDQPETVTDNRRSHESPLRESWHELGDSPDVRRKNTDKRCSASMGQEAQDIENAPESPKNFPPLLSSGNKSFDSHLCRTQCPQSFQSPCKSNDKPERVTVNRRSQESPLGDSSDVRPKTAGRRCPASMGQETQVKENAQESPNNFSSLLSSGNNRCSHESALGEIWHELGDAPDVRPKNTAKRCLASMSQETQDKKKATGSPKIFPSPLSNANKTFDSHLCCNQCPKSFQSPCKSNDQPERVTVNRSIHESPTRPSSRSPSKSNDQHEKVAVNQCIRESPPRVNKSKKLVKCPAKQKEKSTREMTPKICRQGKGQNSHFRTDNRHMTGNVNIYICSEANENTKDKQKSKNKDFLDDTESATSSTLSTASSKLVAALRKKQRRDSDESSSSVSETPESSVKSECKMSDEVLCLCDDDSVDAETPNLQSCSSRDDLICGGENFSDANDDMGSLGDQLYTSSASEECASYDRDNFWPCTTQVCPSYDEGTGSKRYNKTEQDDKRDRNVDDCCSCCNIDVCEKNRPISRASRSPNSRSQKSECRKSQDKTSRTTRDSPQFNKCLCVVEEEDEGCCNDRGKSEVPIQPSNDTETNEPKKSFNSPKLEERKSIRSSKIIPTDIQGNLKEESEVNIDEEPQSPDRNLSSSSKNNFKRSPSTEARVSKAEPKRASIEENQQNSNNPKPVMDNTTAVDDKKRKNSFFKRSITMAMGIVKTRKLEDAKPATFNDEKPKTEDKVNFDEVPKDTEAEKSTVTSHYPLKEENRSRSRIANAISSRRSGGTKSNGSSNVSIPSSKPKMTESSNGSPIARNSRERETEREAESPQSYRVSEQLDCCSQNPEPKDEVCRCNVKCKKTTSSVSVCRQKVRPRSESRVSCPECANRACSCRKAEPPNLTKPIPDCTCSGSKRETVDQTSCNCCRRPKNLCGCDDNRLQLNGSRRPSDFQETSCNTCSNPKPQCMCSKKGFTGSESKQATIERTSCNRCQRPENLCGCDDNRSPLNGSRLRPDFRETPCNSCRNPKARCMCVQKVSTWDHPKSMICMYCDKPQDKCVCKAPIRKCSQCGLPQDVCNCKHLPCYDCRGRQIYQDEPNDKPSISVTAWKPRRSVRRYFSRDQNDTDGHFEEDCSCFEKSIPYGSDKLPYQRGTGFSDVMSELQQKISGLVSCDVCRNVSGNCCCNETEQKQKPKRRSSTINERKPVRQSQDRSRSKSPEESCRCGKPRGKSRRKVGVQKICGRCRTSPCRCRRNSASPQKKPSAKCYYCKSSPCVCPTPSEPANLRPFRKAESSHRRKKICYSKEEHTNADVENEDNGHRGRETSHLVPCPGRQQPRKYRYRENSTG